MIDGLLLSFFHWGIVHVTARRRILSRWNTYSGCLCFWNQTNFMSPKWRGHDREQIFCTISIAGTISTEMGLRSRKRHLTFVFFTIFLASLLCIMQKNCTDVVYHNKLNFRIYFPVDKSSKLREQFNFYTLCITYLISKELR